MLAFGRRSTTIFMLKKRRTSYSMYLQRTYHIEIPKKRTVSSVYTICVYPGHRDKGQARCCAARWKTRQVKLYIFACVRRRYDFLPAAKESCAVPVLVRALLKDECWASHPAAQPTGDTQTVTAVILVFIFFIWLSPKHRAAPNQTHPTASLKKDARHTHRNRSHLGLAKLLVLGLVRPREALEVDLGVQPGGPRLFQGREVHESVLPLHPPKRNVHQRRAVEQAFQRRAWIGVGRTQLRHVPGRSWSRKV